MLGLFFREIEVGSKVELGAYTFTEQNISLYAAQFAPVPFQLDDTDAASGLFGRKVAAGFHLCSAWMACFVAANAKARKLRETQGVTLPDIGPSPGIESVVWPSPVFAGDLVNYTTTVTAKRELRSRPGWGLVSACNSGHKQDGQLVLEFISKVLVQR